MPFVTCSSFSDYPTVHFDSHDISKPDSSSYLNQLDDDEMSGILSDGDKMMSEPRKETLDVIVKEVRTKLGLTLFGIDVIIEKGTGRYAIIDMNVFPGNTSLMMITLCLR